ncbi:MAG: DUF192 domain-containing protein [Actinobacteria bacterium]|nr:DUF192 domain-containing protein [Actinomycetota bacterium]
MKDAIVVERTGKVLAVRVRWAGSSRERRRGLLDGPPLEGDEGLVIPGAFQVHTFGMTYPIDVVFCSRAWIVKRVVRNMPPGRISRPSAARYAVELTGGRASAVRVGDRLVVDQPLSDQPLSER